MILARYFVLLIVLFLTAVKFKKVKHKELTNQLVRYNIIAGDTSENKPKETVSFFTIAFRVLIFSIFVEAFAPASIGLIMSNIKFPLILIIFFIVNSNAFKLSITSEKLILKHALKCTDVPESVVSFKIDMHNIVYGQPEYLYNHETQERFPLYTCLENLDNLLYSADADTKSPLVNEYIIDNIVLLSTFTSILKSESLVESLKTDLGKQELNESVKQFHNLNEGLDDVLEFIKQEKIYSENLAESNKVLNDLNAIRSMKEFAKDIK